MPVEQSAGHGADREAGGKARGRRHRTAVSTVAIPLGSARRLADDQQTIPTGPDRHGRRPPAPAVSRACSRSSAAARLLVLEIVAGRIIAPSVGVSLYTWTSVIGVVLAGLAIGNWLGGRIADRATRPHHAVGALPRRRPRRTALILFFARDVERLHGAHLVAGDPPGAVDHGADVLPAVHPAGHAHADDREALAAARSTRPGASSGDIQAAATAGSILGVFLTGFALISWFGTRAIVAGVVVLLLLLAAFSHPYLTDTSRVAQAVRRQPALAIVPAVVLVGGARRSRCRPRASASRRATTSASTWARTRPGSTGSCASTC